ncbi:carbohydrate ABC transporter permease [Pseudonocardia sp. CA-107938]|uniref:carbohydrate ABC transporter permease n=1 Tax=Pseudonocardia sp. CA-107938 TaxID=3240021 RepID=UPI003D8B8609
MTDQALVESAAATPPPAPPAASPRSRRATSGARPLWLMWPNLLLLIVVIAIPFLIAVYISFIDLDQYTLRRFFSAPFVALDNYLEALATANLLHSVWISVAFSLLTTLFAAPLGILAAMALNTRFRGRALIRSAFLIPYVLPSFVTATLWRFILQPSGAGNQVLGWFGIEHTQWLIGGNAFWALVLVDVWASWPFLYMMAMAGLQNIPSELYEAADIDGATWRQKIRFVVLPQLRGQLLLGLLLSTLAHFNNFTLPFVLLGTPAPDAALTLPVNVFQTSFQVFRFGLGGAMAVISLVLMLIPAVIYLRASRLTANVGEE